MSKIGNFIAKCLDHEYVFYAFILGFIVCGLLSATGAIGWTLLLVNLGIGVLTQAAIWVNNFNHNYPTSFKELLYSLIGFIVGSLILTVLITLDL